MGKFGVARSLILTLSLALAGCTGLVPVTPVPQRPVAVEVLREGDRWSATYALPADAPIWAMQRSGQLEDGGGSWRAGLWRVTTPGVTLQRVGEHDALVADTGNVPREVQLEFDVEAVDVVSDHDPAILMSNGSVALFTGAFTMFPMRDIEQLRGMDHVYRQAALLTFRDAAAPVFFNGSTVPRAMLEEDDYVLFGPAEIVEAAHADIVLDPGLPDWLAEELSAFTARAFAEYARRLGPSPDGTPMLLATWSGDEEGVALTAGTASGRTLTMSFGGSGFAKRDYPALVYAQRLIAHEAAHVWLGQHVGVDRHAYRWITEGGAVLLAVRMQEALDVANADEAEAFAIRQRLISAIGEGTPYAVSDYLGDARKGCPAWLANGGLSGAQDRLEERAFYDCGAMFALAVEQAGEARGEDFFDFVALLIARNPDGSVTPDEWFAAAREFGVADENLDLMRQLVDEGTPDGELALARLLS